MKPKIPVAKFFIECGCVILSKNNAHDPKI